MRRRLLRPRALRGRLLRGRLLWGSLLRGRLLQGWGGVTPEDLNCLNRADSAFWFARFMPSTCDATRGLSGIPPRRRRETRASRAHGMPNIGVYIYTTIGAVGKGRIQRPA